MKIVQLHIENFRGIKKGTLIFEGHTLLVGPNNIGKSTICEALDLVLGPDRLSRYPPVNEYDFYNANYFNLETEDTNPLIVEAVLTDLSDELIRDSNANLEFWHSKEKRVLDEGEIKQVDSNHCAYCLRIKTIGEYDPEDDEFKANTYYSHSPNANEDELTRVTKTTKRLIGFLYLRTLRTGSRALSLERGSLLDIILKLLGIRTGLWEKVRNELKNIEPSIDDITSEISPVLDAIENRISQYIPLSGESKTTSLHISKLTRDHLRQTISFFLSTSDNQEPIPFQYTGTGTLNTLVLTLLSFIAEVKADNVIFAMEEPEIALPPHTQRRIANYLLSETTQCFVTSHSPYIIESFSPKQIRILNKTNNATLSAQPVKLGNLLKEKTYRKQIRRGIAEAILGNGVIVVEGITEVYSFNKVSEILEENNNDYFPFDLSGVTIFSSDGDGKLAEYGQFFSSLGLKSFAFFDRKNRSEKEIKELEKSYDISCEIPYKGMESLLVNEISVDYQWKFLHDLNNQNQLGNLKISDSRPEDEEKIKNWTKDALKSGKGDGWSAILLDYCSNEDLPVTISIFLDKIYELFPRPKIEKMDELSSNETS